MKRRLLIISICVLLGAVVNVAVAWGCAGWRTNRRGMYQLIEAPEKSDWVQSLPARRGLRAADISVRAAIGLVLAELDAFALSDSLLGQRRSATVQWCRSGWPSLALAGEKISYTTAGVYRLERSGVHSFPAERVDFHWAIGLGESDERLFEHWAAVLPLKPIWPGFAINTIFYAALLWLLIPGPFVLRRFLRLRRGLCPKCAYPMGESAVCTECGGALPSPVRVT